MLISQAKLLYQLQILDLAISQRQSRLNEIEAVLGQNPLVMQARQTLDAATQALTPWQISARDLDLEIKSVIQKTKTAEQTLYGGKITNPKELTDMQQEIESLKRRQSQLEDTLLEAMLHTEEGQAAVTTARGALSEAEVTWSGSQTDLLAEKQRLEVELANYKTKREKAVPGIEPQALAKYEALRPKKHGRAVALLQNDSCTVCGVEQTSVIAQQVLHGDQLVYCLSCGRLLAAG